MMWWHSIVRHLQDHMIKGWLIASMVGREMFRSYALNFNKHYSAITFLGSSTLALATASTSSASPLAWVSAAAFFFFFFFGSSTRSAASASVVSVVSGSFLFYKCKRTVVWLRFGKHSIIKITQWYSSTQVEGFPCRQKVFASIDVPCLFWPRGPMLNHDVYIIKTAAAFQPLQLEQWDREQYGTKLMVSTVK